MNRRRLGRWLAAVWLSLSGGAVAVPASAGASPAPRTATVTSTAPRLLTLGERDLLRIELDAELAARQCLARLGQCRGDLADARAGLSSESRALVTADAVPSQLQEPTPGWIRVVFLGGVAILSMALGAAACAALHCGR